MKIAIQGHPTKGQEIIQILESLGGINQLNLLGTNSNRYYYIYDNNTITNMHYTTSYKIYTLEEFKKAFPFKVGDKVRDCFDNEIGIIFDLIDIDNKLMYNVDFVNSGQAFMSTNELKPYKEMKEERNITLTLDKAKEWYNKGGELKEIALQAFTEKELKLLPRSWEEFCKNYPIKDKEAHFDSMSSIVIQNGNTTWRASMRDRNICPSKKSAQAHLAMIQLEQLRDCWRQGWEPVWDCSEKWYIRSWGNSSSIGVTTQISKFLTFPTREMTEEFLKCFKDLIEVAKDFI